MKGLCGFGRYDDGTDAISCPYAKSDMTPCMARDGESALDDDGTCVGCGKRPIDLLVEIVREISAIPPNPSQGKP